MDTHVEDMNVKPSHKSDDHEVRRTQPSRTYAWPIEIIRFVNLVGLDLQGCKKVYCSFGLQALICGEWRTIPCKDSGMLGSTMLIAYPWEP